MTEWDELVGHPAWKKLEAAQRERRAELVERLIALGAKSSDASVAGVSRQIIAIDELLRIPHEEAEIERDRAGSY